MKPNALLLAAVLLASVVSPRPFEAGTQSLRGNVPKVVPELKAVGELPGTQRLDIVIGLPLRNRAALTNLLGQLYDPNSRQYHHFLTPEQFTEKFGPTEADYRAIAALAQVSGLTATHTHRNRTLLDLSGAVGDVEKPFHVTLREYQHPKEPRTFYAPDTEPRVDADVPILSVAGLDNYQRPHPMSLKFSVHAPGRMLPLTGSAPSNNYAGNDFRAAYVPGVSLTGAGQTVGLLEFDGYYPADIATYESLFHLPPVPLTNIIIDGAIGTPGDANDEVSLDIEMAASMAPGLSGIVVYEAGPNAVNGDDMLNEMAAPSQGEPLSFQLSASWTYPTTENTDQIFQEFAAQGQSYFNASGDSKAYAAGDDVPTPAGDTNITIVGGTTLTTSGPGGSWVSETAWNWDYLDMYNIGTSGGITSFGIPAWQEGIDMLTNLGSTLQRNIPDVALTADNVWVLYGNGQSNEFGGTSCATPLWAAFTALVNEQAAFYGRRPQGFLNPAIYALGKGPFYTNCFHDITTGNNIPPGGGNYYSAVAGYDLCTGWGTPIGTNLISALVPADWLILSPNGGFISSGNPGGPFSVISQSLTLTNSGTTNLDWSVNNTSPWLTVSVSQGALAPGEASAPVIVGLNSAAGNLPPGAYTATLWFSNMSDSVGQGCAFILNVLGAPSMTMEPQDDLVCAGQSATFSIGASGAAPLSYAWISNGVSVPGGTNATYTLNDAQLSSSGSQFYCVVSNSFGTVAGSVAAVDVVPPPFYSFSGPDGAQPYGGLVAGSDGNLYGTCNVGGDESGHGTVFKITTSGALTTLFTFDGFDGSNPATSMVQGADGNFYGTTPFGGDSVFSLDFGYGSLFSVSASGEFSDLASFYHTNGSDPYGPLLQSSDGNFYGTTSWGGIITASNIFGFGIVFRMSPGGQLTTLYAFSGPDGENPNGAIVQGSDGSLYGTTDTGGAYNQGTIYRLSTNGVLTTLFTFNTLNGSEPYGGLILAADGNLYGTTEVGGSNGLGTVYRVSTNGALTTLVSFDIDNGCYPLCTLMQGVDGNFYGTTTAGGDYGYGTVFQLRGDGRLSTLRSFAGINGIGPVAGVAQGSDGNIYGVTQLGGAYDNGTVFMIVPPPDLPMILAQPLSQAVTLDGTATFAVDATNRLPLTYTWFKNGLFIPGATNSTLSLTNVGIQNVGNYDVVITSALGSVTSSVVTLTITNEACSEPLPGLVAWWPGQSNAVDIIGGNNGVLVDTVGFTNALVGNGFSFDGSGGYVQLPENLFPMPNAGPFSIELWFETASGGVILEEQDVPNGWVPDFYVGTDGNLYAQLFWDGTFNQIRTTTPVNDGAFHHGAVTYDGLNEVLYVDGAKVGATTLQYSSYTSNFFCQLGTGYTQYWQAGNGGWFPFTGIIDEVSLYSNTLTADQVRAIYNAGTAGKCMAELLPAILTQPVCQTVFAGETALFTVTAASFLPLAYQWFEDGAPLADATNSSYSVTNAQLSESGTQFSCWVSTTQGATNSAVAVLTVMGPPLVVVEPASQTVLTGGSAVFTINALGSPPLFYFWLSNNTPIADATNSTYSLNNVPLSDSGAQFSCLVSNFLGTTNSAAATLTVTTNLSPVAVLYSFGGPDGAGPQAGLVQGSDGNFYGTTAAGGASGHGTVFQFTTHHALTSLASFAGINGSAPEAPLIQGVDGNFYGTTTSGGSSNDGTVFRVSTNGALASLVSFAGTNGAVPKAGLVQAGDGSFYGTTEVGGGATPYSGYYGTVFRMASNGAITTLVGFTSSNGAAPNALVWGSDGALYGTAQSGGLEYGQIGYSFGTAFRTTTNGLLTTLYTFNEFHYYDPTTPNSLWAGNDGNFYGTTLWGGWSNGAGTIFRLTTNGAITPLVYFGDTNGAIPQGGLMQAGDGNFYGTTETGGDYGDGTVFRMTTNGVLTTLFSFSGTNGSSPEGILAQGADGNLYGTTTFGGTGYNESPTSGNGAIFVVFLSFNIPLAITSVALLPTGSVQLTMTGPPGNVFRVVSSTDLLTWQTIATLTNLDGPCTFTDSATTNLTARFYRLVSP